MQCTHCGASLEDNRTVCPACGAMPAQPETELPPQVQDELFQASLPDGDYDPGEEYEDFEPRQQKPRGRGKGIALVALILVCCLVIGLFAALFLGRDKAPDTGAAESDGYIVAEFDGHSLTNQTFQYYYWAQFYDLYNYYGSYLSYIGLDLNTPFEDQQFDETRTWADYLGEFAFKSWYYDRKILDAAQAQGYVLSDDARTELQQTLDSLESEAVNAGYENAEMYLKQTFDLSADLSSYAAYVTDAFTCTAYVNDIYAAFQAAGEADPGTYTDVHYINIRHILFKFADDTDDAKATAKSRAEALYQSFCQNPTKDNFAALAKEHSDDGSAAEGGLIEDVYPGQMVESFNDWCFDPQRKAGDHGLVESEYGWHLMFFDSVDEQLYTSAAQAYADAQYQIWLDTVVGEESYRTYPERITYRHGE